MTTTVDDGGIWTARISSQGETLVLGARLAVVFLSLKKRATHRRLQNGSLGPRCGHWQCLSRMASQARLVKFGAVLTAFTILLLITFPFLQALPGPYGLHLWYHVHKNHTVAGSSAVFDSPYLLFFLVCLQELRAMLLTLPWPQLLPLSSGGSLFLMTALKWRQRAKPLFSTFIFGHHFSLPLTHL